MAQIQNLVIQNLAQFRNMKTQNNSRVLDVPDRYWRQRNDDKLIIFLHFHKAGGMSLIDAARAATVFCKSEQNGNPAKHKYLIPFPLFEQAQFTEFVVDLIAHNVSFIAMENEWFAQPEVISTVNAMQFMQARGKRIELIVRFRNPFQRFLSNFFYAAKYNDYEEPALLQRMDIRTRLLGFHNDSDTAARFQGEQSWNMYVRILSRQFAKPHVNETDLLVAKQQLAYFQVITILEMPETWQLLAVRYGIQSQLHHANENRREYRHPDDARILAEFEKEFEVLNKYDYLLYDYAINLSLSMRSSSISSIHTLYTNSTLMD